MSRQSERGCPDRHEASEIDDGDRNRKFSFEMDRRGDSLVKKLV
jgi:hypothetical protein